MKRWIAVLLLMFLIIGLVACDNAEPLSPEQQFYVDYINYAKEDQAGANVFYVHFEDEQYRAMAYEDMNLVTDYEIYEWIQLSETLWVVDVKICSQLLPEGVRVFNFVGHIDGELRVMQNVAQIPVGLKGDLDLTAYEFKGW